MPNLTINELPSNEDAERSLIGLTLVKRQIPSGAKTLATTDFYAQINRETWAAFLELEADGKEIEPISAHEILKRDRPELAAAFPISSMIATASGMPDCNERVFVEKVRSAANSRYIIRKLTDNIRAISSGEKGAIHTLRRDLNDLEYIEEARGKFRPLSDILEKDVKPALADLRHGITRKISTGFDAIDRCIGGGLSLSDILLIAGVPGGGKSALVLQMAVNIARQNIPVAFLSGEMSDKENAFRIISQAAGAANLNALTHIGDDELHLFTQWADALKNLPLYFDSRTYDLRSISSALRSLVEETGVKVLVIDYIQLLKLNKFDKHQRTERITETSQEVKRIAMEYGIAVIEVAQFNREGAKSAKPTMHDLEGSSQLEKDTSLIFLIDREEDSYNVTLRVAKGRNSGQSEIAGRFIGWKLTFEF
jgi:replicative DNA helicase